MELVTLPM